MKNVFLITLVSLFLVSCQTFYGEFEAVKQMVLKGRSGELTLRHGFHKGKFNFKSKSVGVLTFTRGANRKAYFHFPVDSIPNSDGPFWIYSIQTGQPYDVEVERVTKKSSSEERVETEECSYFSNEGEKMGNRYVTYFMNYTEIDMTASFYGAQDKEFYGKFVGVHKSEDRVVTKKETCQ
jgi:hypothetical protein